MTKTMTLVDELLHRASIAHLSYYSNLSGNAALDRRAANEITRLTAENERLREALRSINGELAATGPTVTHDIFADRRKANNALRNIGGMVRAALEHSHDA